MKIYQCWYFVPSFSLFNKSTFSKKLLLYIFSIISFIIGDFWNRFQTENRHFMLVFTVKKAFRFLALHKLYFTSHIYSAKI